MKRSVIVNLGVGILTVILIYGCQMTCGRCDEKRINSTMADWKAALTAKDLGKVMAVYSENYLSQWGNNKDSIRKFMVRFFDEGWIDKTKINLEDAETTIEGDKAEFGPVEFTSDRGTMKIQYTLKKEDGAWLIVGFKEIEAVVSESAGHTSPKRLKK